MASTSISLFVSYSQLCVFLSELPQPFNVWLQTHVDQGFSWRRGSAGFRTLEESGQHLVDLEVSKHPIETSADAIRVTEVPFDIPVDGNIEVASISDSVAMTLPAGLYTLRCELFPQTPDEIFPVRLIFIRSDNPEFKILRVDDDLAPPVELLRDADPA